MRTAAYRYDRWPPKMAEVFPLPLQARYKRRERRRWIIRKALHVAAILACLVAFTLAAEAWFNQGAITSNTGQLYTVQPGDNIDSIAAKADKQNAANVAWWMEQHNAHVDVIYPGEKIWMPAR